jgi:hypothetical protein
VRVFESNILGYDGPPAGDANLDFGHKEKELKNAKNSVNTGFGA